MIHVIKLCNKMSQLLVTSAPVIYIFLLLERKQQKWSLLKRANTVNGKTSWWVQCKLNHFVWGTIHSSTCKFCLGVMQIRLGHMIWHTVEISEVSSGTLSWIKTKRQELCVPPSQLNWVHYKLPPTEATPRKKAYWDLGQKMSGLYGLGTSYKPLSPVPGVPEKGLQ